MHQRRIVTIGIQQIASQTTESFCIYRGEDRSGFRRARARYIRDRRQFLVWVILYSGQADSQGSREEAQKERILKPFEK